MQPIKHPLDFDALKKGDVIPASQIEKIVGLSVEDKNYRLKLLELKNEVERELAFRGNPSTVISRNDELHILSDQESAVYNPWQYKQWMSRAWKAHYRLLTTVNVTKLDLVQRQDYERNVEIQGKQLQAVASIKQISVPAQVRKTPGLLSF